MKNVSLCSVKEMNQKHLKGLWISLVALVVLTLLFPLVNDALVGQAIEAPSGYHLEQSPVGADKLLDSDESCPSGFYQIPNNIYEGGYFSSKTEFYNQFRACCPTVDMCGANAPDILSSGWPTNFGCFYSGSAVFTPDDKSWICSTYIDQPAWIRCDSAQEGELVEGLFCDGDEWVPNYCESSTKGDLASNSRYYCDGSEWQQCNAEIDGQTTTDGSYWCKGLFWKNTFELKEDEFYEVQVVKGSPAKDIESKLDDYKDIEICSDDIGFDRIDICKSGDDFPSLNKISDMKKNDQTPYEQDDLLFLYEGPTDPKKASIHLLLEIFDEPTNGPVLNRNNFINNMENGRRLTLKYAGQYEDQEAYYIMSSTNDPAKGDFGSLSLTHVPLGTVHEATWTPKGRYQFELDGGRSILIEEDDVQKTFKIFAGPPEEAFAGFPSQNSLTADYEIPFGRNNPAQLEDQGGIGITVCEQDGKNVETQMLVCIRENNDSVLQITLTRDELTATTLSTGQEIALLFQMVDNGKQGYVFLRHLVEEEETDLIYDYFQDNLPEERRLAITFEGAHYLLDQSTTGFLSLQDMTLTHYGGITDAGPSDIRESNAKGSELAVEFGIDEGKIFLEQELLDIPPPFKIKGITTKQLFDLELDLTKELYTTVSTKNPVKITNPNFGIISTADKDLDWFEESFQLDASALDTPDDEIYLDKNEKVLLKDGVEVLFHYSDAQEVGDVFRKTAEIYLLYDTQQTPAADHDFDNDFIEIFTGGKELALLFEDEYYILGYKGGKGKFDMDELVLESLDGEFEAPLIVEGLTAIFETPDGNIEVIVDDKNFSITFRGEGATSLITEQFDGVSEFLTPENKIKIGNTIYSIADTPSTELNPEVVLVSSGNAPEIFLKNVPKVKDGYLFWYRGVINGQKQVSIHNIIKNFPFIKSRSEIVQWIGQGKSPAFQMGEDYAMLTMTDVTNPATLQFTGIADGDTHGLEGVESDVQGLYNGTIEFRGNLIEMTEKFTSGFDIETSFSLATYKIIPFEGLEVADNVEFAVDVGEDVYTMNYFAGSFPRLVQISDGGIIYNNKLDLGESKDVLLPSGDIITITAFEDYLLIE